MYDHQDTSAARVVLGYGVEVGLSHVAAFIQQVVARGLQHELNAHWDTTATAFDGLLEQATRSSRHGPSFTAVLDFTEEAGWLALVSVYSGIARANLAGESIDALSVGEAFLRERLPERVPTDNQTIPMSFWSYGRCGATESTRSLEVPTWAEIRRNYPPRVGDQLERLMDPDFRPGGRGQLILWYGVPGTGKTYGLRALAWQWREWCSFHYVTNPETVFGRPDYMLDVLLGDEGPEDAAWRILLLEDTGELLAADAKAQAGQALSRLLNVVDGIIGQGLRVPVLVTTNDELHQLHPAVSRPGRCLARVEFVPFAGNEAEEWLEENGVEPDGHAGTLASLFAAASGEELAERPAVGFVR